MPACGSTHWNGLEAGTSSLNACYGLAAVSFFGTRTTPHGLWPALMRSTSFWPSRSTIDTSSEGPLAEYNHFPSGEMAMPQGRWPTLIVLRSSSPEESSTTIEPALPVLTYTLRPSGDTFKHIGRQPFGSFTVLRTVFLSVSTKWTSPADSDGI